MKENRYYAKQVRGLGYIFDREFSNEVPIAVENSIENAQILVDRFNKELN